MFPGGEHRAQIWSFDLVNNYQRWSQRFSCGRVVDPSMAIGNGWLVASLADCPDPSKDQLVMFDVATGKNRRVLEYDDLSAPAVAGTTAIVNDAAAGQVHLVDLVTRTRDHSVGYSTTDFPAPAAQEPLPVIDGQADFTSHRHRPCGR